MGDRWLVRARVPGSFFDTPDEPQPYVQKYGWPGLRSLPGEFITEPGDELVTLTPYERLAGS